MKKLLILLILFPNISNAALNTFEKDKFRILSAAMEDVNRASLHLGTIISIAASDVNARKSIADAWDSMIRWRREVEEANSILVGVNPINEGIPNRIETWEGLTRDEQLQRSRNYYRRAIENNLAGHRGIPGTIAYLEQAKLFFVTNQSYQSNIVSIQSILNGVKARFVEILNVISPIAPNPPIFLDPFPSISRFGPILVVFGPHGDYKKSQHSFLVGFLYTNDSMDQGLIPFYRLRGNSNNGRHFNDIVKALYNINSALISTRSLVSGVRVTNQDDTSIEALVEDALKELENLEVTASQGFEFAIRSNFTELAKDIDATSLPFYKRALNRWADAWANATDRAAWRLQLCPNGGHCTAAE